MQVGWDAQAMLPPSISIHVMVMVGVLLASRSRHYRVIITKVVNTAAAGRRERRARTFGRVLAGVGKVRRSRAGFS